MPTPRRGASSSSRDASKPTRQRRTPRQSGAATVKRLSAAQRRLAALLANPADERTTSEKITAAKCKEAKFDAWVRQPEFVAYVVQLTQQYTDIEQARVWGTLLKDAEGGNTKTAQLFLEMKQKLRARADSPASQEPILLRWEEGKAATKDEAAAAVKRADGEESAPGRRDDAAEAPGPSVPRHRESDEPSPAAADDAAPAP